jgi:hypothetical protein
MFKEDAVFRACHSCMFLFICAIGQHARRDRAVVARSWPDAFPIEAFPGISGACVRVEALFYNNCVSFLKKYISQIAKCIFSSLTKRMHAKCKR